MATSWLGLGATAFTHRVLLDIMIAALPGAWFAMYGAALFYNEALDPGSARRVTVPVYQAYRSQSRKHQHWYLESRRWPDPRVERTVEISREEFALVQARHCVDVLWRDGRLGDGWVESYLESAAPTCEEGVEK